MAQSSMYPRSELIEFCVKLVQAYLEDVGSLWSPPPYDCDDYPNTISANLKPVLMKLVRQKVRPDIDEDLGSKNYFQVRSFIRNSFDNVRKRIASYDLKWLCVTDLITSFVKLIEDVKVTMWCDVFYAEISHELAYELNKMEPWIMDNGGWNNLAEFATTETAFEDPLMLLLAYCKTEVDIWFLRVLKMPFEKAIRNLADLCLQTVAENIVFYSHMFRLSAKNEKLRTELLIFRRLFEELLLEKLFLFHEHNRSNTASTTELPVDCLFLGRTGLHVGGYNKERLQMCLDFIFNEQTENIFAHFSCRLRPRISKDVFSHIFTRCKSLKHLDLHRACFNESHFLKALPEWNSLVRLNLSQTSCTDVIIMRIWDFLPDLRELLLSFCWEVTDESLLHLCKTHYKNGVQDMCDEHGRCTHLGKRLKLLDIDCTRVTLLGVTCALLHLQSLEYFFQAEISWLKEYIPFGLLKISNDKHRPFFALKQINCKYLNNAEDVLRVLSLTPALGKLCISATIENFEILTRNYIWSIHSMCVVFRYTKDLHTEAFKIFIKKYGGRLKTLILHFEPMTTEELDVVEMRHLVDILTECKNLKELRITGFLKLADAPTDFTFEVPHCIEGLKILDLTGLKVNELSHYEPFLEVLKQPRNLKVFQVSNSIAENLLLEILRMTNFSTLEKIVIRGTNTRKIPTQLHLNNQRNLKEIEFSECLGDSFIETCRKFSKERNFFLNENCTYRRSEFFRNHRCCHPKFREFLWEIIDTTHRDSLRELFG